MGQKNAVLGRYKGGYREKVDSSDISSNGRREGFLSLANVEEPTAVDNALSTYIAELVEPTANVTAGIEALTSAETPYLGWRVRHQITVPDEDGTPTAYRVSAITVTEDDATGDLTFVPELRSNLDVMVQRHQTWLDRLSNGTLNGRGAGTVPIVGDADPDIVASTKQAIQTQSFSQQLPEALESPPWSPTHRGRIVAVDAKLEVNPGTAGTILKVKKNGTAVTWNQNGTSTSSLVMPAGVNWIYCYLESADIVVEETDKITIECVQAGDETEQLNVQVYVATDADVGSDPDF